MLVLKNTAMAAALAVIFVGGGVRAEEVGTDVKSPVLPMIEQMAPMSGEHHHRMAMSWKHIEGDIAFLKVELKITEAQSASWAVFADALRANSKIIAEIHAKTNLPVSAIDLPHIIDEQEKILTDHLSLLHTLQGVVTPLYAVLNDEQKQIANLLIKEMCSM